jgi:hypothetical protein
MAEEKAVPADKDVIAKCTCKIKTTDYDVRLTDAEFRWHIAGNKQMKGKTMYLRTIYFWCRLFQRGQKVYIIS